MTFVPCASISAEISPLSIFRYNVVRSTLARFAASEMENFGMIFFGESDSCNKNTTSCTCCKHCCTDVFAFSSFTVKIIFVAHVVHCCSATKRNSVFIVVAHVLRMLQAQCKKRMNSLFTLLNQLLHYSFSLRCFLLRVVESARFATVAHVAFPFIRIFLKKQQHSAVAFNLLTCFILFSACVKRLMKRVPTGKLGV